MATAINSGEFSMKKTKSPRACVLAIFASAMLCVPGELTAAPDTAGQQAGEVSRIIPAVSIARGAKTISASARTVVDWQDVVNTQASARARVALDDGSILNVGSESSIKVVKHDGGAQQTELELTYGKIRSQAQKITKPDGKFEVKTPATPAGVFTSNFPSGLVIFCACDRIFPYVNSSSVCCAPPSCFTTLIDDSEPTFKIDPSSNATRARALACVFTTSCQSTTVLAEAEIVFAPRAMLTAGIIRDRSEE